MGCPAWIECVAGRSDIDLTPDPRGLPRKEEPAWIVRARKMIRRQSSTIPIIYPDASADRAYSSPKKVDHSGKLGLP